jgi:hypothetical protein
MRLRIATPGGPSFHSPAPALYYAGPIEQPRALSWNKKISTVKWFQYIICCRFETVAVDINTVLENPAAKPNG